MNSLYSNSDIAAVSSEVSSSTDVVRNIPTDIDAVKLVAKEAVDGVVATVNAQLAAQPPEMEAKLVMVTPQTMHLIVTATASDGTSLSHLVEVQHITVSVIYRNNGAFTVLTLYPSPFTQITKVSDGIFFLETDFSQYNVDGSCEPFVVEVEVELNGGKALGFTSPSEDIQEVADYVDNNCNGVVDEVWEEKYKAVTLPFPPSSTPENYYCHLTNLQIPWDISQESDLLVRDINKKGGTLLREETRFDLATDESNNPVGVTVLSNIYPNCAIGLVSAQRLDVTQPVFKRSVDYDNVQQGDIGHENNKDWEEEDEENEEEERKSGEEEKRNFIVAKTNSCRYIKVDFAFSPFDIPASWIGGNSKYCFLIDGSPYSISSDCHVALGC